MNTQYIRKQVIALKLGELLTGTCKYSPDTQARWGVIEPDQDHLVGFMSKLPSLSWMHFQDILTVEEIQDIINYCEMVARPIGHLMSDGGLTGTWGVRISELNEIIKVLELPDFDLLPISTEFEYYGVPVRITDYRVTEDWVVVTYQQLDEYEGTWEACVNWKDLYKDLGVK